MMSENAFYNLENRMNSLKSKLRHEQLKYGVYPFNKFKSELSLVLDAYRTHKSIFKAASSVGVDKDLAMKWFIQGMAGDPEFREYFLTINRINGFKLEIPEEDIPKDEEKKAYDISQSGNAWVYTTDLNGEKLSIISSDLEQLRRKVMDRNLPLT